MTAITNWPYLTQTLTVFVVTVVAMISPGPDFVVIARNSLVHSRRAGICSALGMASAVWLHVAYSLAGLGLIISQSIVLFAAVRYVGAAYLVYLGVQGLRAQPGATLAERAPAAVRPMGMWPAYRMGFLTNALNPKATLFFLALFTQVVRPDTPLTIDLLYGLMASVTGALWFSLVAVGLSYAPVRSQFQRSRRYLERAVGGILILLGLDLAFSHIRR